MLNRKETPAVFEIRELPLPQPQLRLLDNGMPVYILPYPGRQVLKVEVSYQAGRPEEVKPMSARATARLLSEGSRRRNSAEIAEWFDFYGSSFSNPANLDTANFILFTLEKYAEAVLPVFAETLLEPAFPESELQNFQETNIRELMVELDKVEVLAYRQITEAMFGSAHPYGYNSTPEMYRALTQADLKDFYQRWFTPANGLIFVSGEVTDRVLELLNQTLGQTPARGQKPAFSWKHPTPNPVRQHIPHPGALQTGIKIGRRTFHKKHPDYNGMYVLNTILGGYFGSRLMLNIREKRGYTYNIYSSLDAMLHDGYFYIATEVSSDKTQTTVKQIFREMRRLQEQPVPTEELNMVRNYLMGMLLNGLDGPLNSSDVVKSLIVDGLQAEHFHALAYTIRSITPEEIMQLAQRYFNPEDFWVVTVG
jgi:predicted Zn-dependent peptidase